MSRALLPCYCCLLAATCCSRLLHLLPPLAFCENQARGRSGLKAILGRVLSNQSLSGLVALWSTKSPRFTRGKNPIGSATKGAMSGVTPTLAVRSRLSNMSSFAHFETSDEPLSTPPTPTPATMMLAPTDMQELSLSHNEFALRLQSLLRPSSALYSCEFATCMRGEFPPLFPRACVRSRDPPWPCLQVNSNCICER